jgi:hypothetical protein
MRFCSPPPHTSAILLFFAPPGFSLISPAVSSAVHTLPLLFCSCFSSSFSSILLFFGNKKEARLPELPFSHTIILP